MLCLTNEIRRDALGLFHADQTGIGGLADGHILTRGLPELFARRRAVENVVDDLKRQTNVLRVSLQLPDLLFARPPRMAPAVTLTSSNAPVLCA